LRKDTLFVPDRADNAVVGTPRPAGEPGATPEWILLHLDETLAVIERLWRKASCPPTADAFLDRMAWLPPLLAALDEPTPFNG
jgi:hypothetical protein